MSGYNWSTSNINSSGSGSAVLAPSGFGSDSSSSQFRSSYSLDEPFNNYAANEFNKELYNRYNENNKYNEYLSNKEYKTNYNALTRMYNLVYNNFLENRAYYTNLANNAIQRQMQDMKKAGINPILAARYGGAQVPLINIPSVNMQLPILNYNKSTLADYENEQMQLLQLLLSYATGLNNNATSRWTSRLTNATNYDIQRLKNEGALNEIDLSNQYGIARDYLNYNYDVALQKKRYELETELNTYLNNLNLSNYDRNYLKDFFKNAFSAAVSGAISAGLHH